ncbi:hypothetical protein ACFYY3_21310 [Streptomyces sp. NPDC001812]|uniref:Protein kinase domain-containing protein n=1 Tax=Streptomyces cathayae TaxID=3031124 RepID=A0ABY8JYQ4_9ACTN|nr:hypothetical protein [Streptomyces sp. HUAS 5]WGD39443.1 hypothetical protein PYS65_04425 [Streptomyces sp. HUAS 5]
MAAPGLEEPARARSGSCSASSTRENQGALTHTTAPETATTVLTAPADTHIQAHPAADVWGLGASLFWCWTGHRPVPHPDDVGRTEKLRAIARGSTTAVRDVRPWPFAAFEETLTACLSADPAARPTTGEPAAPW